MPRFKNTAEDQRRDSRDVGDSIELPLASRAILVFAGGTTVVVVMFMEDTEEQRHSQVHQAYD